MNLLGLTFPILEQGQGQKCHNATWQWPCWAAPHAAHAAQPGQHVPSPRAAGPRPAQRSRNAQPPSDGCLGPCGTPVGLIQVLAGRYPCVSELLPARTGLGGCQARAGRGPLRSAGTSRHLPRAQTRCSKSGTSQKASPALWGLQLYPFCMLQLQGEQHRAPKLSQFPSVTWELEGLSSSEISLFLKQRKDAFFAQEGLEKHGKATKRVA